MKTYVFLISILFALAIGYLWIQDLSKFTANEYEPYTEPSNHTPIYRGSYNDTTSKDIREFMIHKLIEDGAHEIYTGENYMYIDKGDIIHIYDIRNPLNPMTVDKIKKERR